MANASIPGRITILNARVRFSQGIFQASSPPGTNSAPAYSCKLILPPNHPQLPEINNKIVQAAQSTFKAQWEATLNQAHAAGKVVLRDGNTATAKDGQVYAGCAGNLVLSARNPQPPIVLDGLKNRVTREQSQIYDGCYVNAQVDIFGYTRGSKGIGARLLIVQFAGGGEPLGGGAPGDESAFGEIEQAAQAGSEFGNPLGVPTQPQAPAQLMPWQSPAQAPAPQQQQQWPNTATPPVQPAATTGDAWVPPWQK